MVRGNVILLYNFSREIKKEFCKLLNDGTSWRVVNSEDKSVRTFITLSAYKLSPFGPNLVPSHLGCIELSLTFTIGLEAMRSRGKHHHFVK